MSPSMPWLVGLPDTDVVWDTLPAPDNMAPSSRGSSVHSMPGTTTRSRLPVAADTVNKRSRSAGPHSVQAGLEWKQRLVHGQVAYGDQTDLFGATGLENIFAKTKVADSDSQTFQPSKIRLSKQNAVVVPSSPPDIYSAFQAKCSPKEDYLYKEFSEMVRTLTGTMQSVQSHNEGMEKRMAALKNSHYSAELAEMRLQEERNERLAAEQRAILAKDENRFLREKIQNDPSYAQDITFGSSEMNTADIIDAVRVHEANNRQNSDEPSSHGGSSTAADSMPSQEMADTEDSSEQIREEVKQHITEYITQPEDITFGDTSMQTKEVNNAVCKHLQNNEEEHISHVEGQETSFKADDTAVSRTLSSEEIAQAEEFTPIIFLPKRSVRQAVAEQRKVLDKTETSQRMREAEIAMGEESAISGASDESSVYSAQENSVRHISGFTDAPDVETFELPTDRRYVSDPWAFSELPVGESSDLLELRELRESQNLGVNTRLPSSRQPSSRPISTRQTSNRQVSFGTKDLDGRTFTPDVSGLIMPKTRSSPPQIRVYSASEAGTIVSKRPPTSPAKDSTPKRRRMATPAQGLETGDYINEAKKIIEIIRNSNALHGITEEDEGFDTEDMGTTKKLENMKTLDPQAVAHLIHGDVKGMTYDRVNQCWIRSKSAEYLDPCIALSSDDDPFREISDLTVDRSQQTRLTKNEASEEKTVLHHEIGDNESFSTPSCHYLSQRYDSPLAAGSPLAADLSLAAKSSLAADSKQAVSVDQSLANFEEMHDSDPSTLGHSDSSSGPVANVDASLANFEEAHASDPSSLANSSEPSDEVPAHIVFPSPPGAKLNATFVLSDLPDFTVAEEDSERPSERVLATRLASYAALEVADPYALASNEVVKAVTDVHGADFYWEDITSLCLSNKYLKSLHSLDTQLPRVEILDASSNALTQLDGIPQYVRQLNVAYNQLTNLTSWIDLMNLQYVDVSGNKLKALDGLGSLIHLREIRCDDNEVTTLEGLSDLDGLLKLSVRNNKIRSLDFHGYKFGRIEELDVSNNEVSLVDGLEELTALQNLTLDNNYLEFTMQVGKQMPRMEHLCLRSCGLSTFDVSAYPNLRTLFVDENALPNIDSLASLTQLDHLSMAKQYLPGDTGITILAQPLEMATLNVSSNVIDTLETEHVSMGVKHLELSHCGIEALPANFGRKFPNLRSLMLDYNALSDIRPLASLRHVQTLSLVGCAVDRLRKTVVSTRDMAQLRHLDLRENPITHGFYGPNGGKDASFRRHMGLEASVRRRVYELMIDGCGHGEGFVLDGMVFDGDAAKAKDRTWEKLVELGIVGQV